MKTFILSTVFLIGLSFNGPMNANNQAQYVVKKVDCAEVAESAYDAMIAMGAENGDALDFYYQVRSGCESELN